MEAPISASLGAMGSLLEKLDEILAAEHRDEIWRLRDDLEITRTLLRKLSKARDPPVTARYWMKDVRELSYDMEDCVDAETDWIDERMSGFRTRVVEANERYHRYMLEDSVPSCADMAIDYRPPVVDGRKAVVGLHAKGGPIDTLCQWLSDLDPELKVASIVGVGGLGKTTLAEQLWHKLGAFQCRAFVRSSKKPDMRGILRSILSQVRPHQPPGVSEVHSLTQDIYKHLQDKSYFVIVDDIWTASVWEVVSRAFPKGNHGSRIVTTVETEDVALACCAYQCRYIFKMEPLSVQHSKELFASALFGSGEKELDEYSHEIMIRCGGLPQAIVGIASILASNRETETIENTEKAGEQWNYLQNYVLNVLAADTPFEEILEPVLNLCYNSLPSCLQTCLLYLSLYSENYIIFKEDLTKQWIVEGFICASTKKETMEVAQSYFDKLVKMGLIQHIDVKNSDEVLSYAVHHMVHDFITFKSIEENFVTAMDYSQSTIQLSDKVRRLSLQFGSAGYATAPASTRLSQVRSLIFNGLVNCMPSISEFKLLRVLILNFWGDQGSTSFDLARISELFLLRYLQIICNVVVQLPEEMQGLEHLETLEINARPDWSLLHLCLGGGTNLPDATPSSSSTSISTMKPCYPFVPVKTFQLLPPICSIPKWIGQLTKLSTLKIVVRELLRDDISNLGGLPALTVLSLYVRRHTAEIIVFNTAQFAALEYFEFKCGALSLAFQEGAMPNLQMLKLGFNAHKGEQYGHFLAGIEHLSNLKEVVGIIGVAGGAEELDWRAAESAFKDAIAHYPKLDSDVNIKRANWIEEEYSSPENQHLIQKHSPSEQPGKIKEESEKDIKLHLIQEKHPPSEQRGKIKEESDKDIKQHSIQEKHPPSEQPGKIKEESDKDITQNAHSESSYILPFIHPDKQNESISRKKKVRRRSTGPDSVAEIIKKWKQQNQNLQEENGSRKAPAKGSKKGCMAGKGGPENSNCKYRGVRQRTFGKWVAEIREPNRGNRLWLGSFPTAVEAAHAYDEAARAMYGATARVNFSERSPDANSGCTSAPPVLMSNGPTAVSHPSDEKGESESPPSHMSDVPTALLHLSDAKYEPESVGTVMHEVKTEVGDDSRSIREERKTVEVFQPQGKALHKEEKVSYDYFNVDEVLDMIIVELSADREMEVHEEYQDGDDGFSLFTY